MKIKRDRIFIVYLNGIKQGTILGINKESCLNRLKKIFTISDVDIKNYNLIEEI